MKSIVKGLVIFAALCLCAGYISSPSRAGVPSQKGQGRNVSGSTSTEELARTKALFDEKCARCHGADGRGKTSKGETLDAPDFTDEGWWKGGKSGARLFTSVAEGKDGMPAFGKKLTPPEIKALAAYVQTFRKAGARK